MRALIVLGALYALAIGVLVAAYVRDPSRHPAVPAPAPAPRHAPPCHPVASVMFDCPTCGTVQLDVPDLEYPAEPTAAWFDAVDLRVRTQHDLDVHLVVAGERRG